MERSTSEKLTAKYETITIWKRQQMRKRLWNTKWGKITGKKEWENGRKVINHILAGDKKIK